MLGNFDKIRKIQQLNEEELKHNIPLTGSWHYKYKDSAYIYIGNFPYELTEGDIVIICSQYGEVVDCRIVRDKESGKSKGFGFVCYEDQRSTILAVDNLNGANIVGRQIRVDHVEEYKIPKEYFELDSDDGNVNEKERYRPTGPDGKGWGKFRMLSKEDKEMFKVMQEEEMKRIEMQKEGFVNCRSVITKEEEWEKKFMEIVNEKKDKIEKDIIKKHQHNKHMHKHKHRHNKHKHYHSKHKKEKGS